jgi:hypothetical protein
MFGLGPRNPQLRVIRLGILVLVILAGVVFHDHGPTYEAIHIGYYVILVAFIGYAFYARSRATRGGGTMGAPGPTPSPTLPGHRGDPSSTVPVPASPPPSTPAPSTQTPGWYPDQQDASQQRYWDGTTWTGTRHWDGSTWVDGRPG